MEALFLELANGIPEQRSTWDEREENSGASGLWVLHRTHQDQSHQLGISCESHVC